MDIAGFVKFWAMILANRQSRWVIFRNGSEELKLPAATGNALAFAVQIGIGTRHSQDGPLLRGKSEDLRY